MTDAQGPAANRMVFPKTRAIVFGVLFLLWLGFLAYLVTTTRGVIVLAQPQVLTANLLIVADVRDQAGRPAATVQVTQVLAAEKDAWKKLAGQSLELDDLPFCSANQGWEGPGSYLIPVTRTEPGQLTIDRVTLLPIVPGYHPAAAEAKVDTGKALGDVAKVLADVTGVPLPRINELMVAPVVEVFNVPLRGFDDQRILAERLAKAGGRLLDFRPGESRIYKANPQVLREAARLRP
jgi:hypothetical protein